MAGAARYRISHSIALKGNQIYFFAKVLLDMCVDYLYQSVRHWRLLWDVGMVLMGKTVFHFFF